MAKGDQNNAETTWEKIDLVLNRQDLWLEAGSKAKSDGIITINSYLKTLNGMPALFFFEDCVRCIQQCLNWARDKDRLESKKNDDQCENLYRLMLLETSYEEPNYNAVMMSSNRQSVDSITGY